MPPSQLKCLKDQYEQQDTRARRKRQKDSQVKPEMEGANQGRSPANMD